MYSFHHQKNIHSHINKQLKHSTITLNTYIQTSNNIRTTLYLIENPLTSYPTRTCKGFKAKPERKKTHKGQEYGRGGEGEEREHEAERKLEIGRQGKELLGGRAWRKRKREKIRDKTEGNMDKE